MRSWYAIRARAEGAEVSIYDEIGAYGVSAKSFLDEIGALPGEAPLTLRLNSPGGSVFDAVAIYNALKRHAGPVSVWIDGIAASAASYVAMAGDEVVMPENTFLMIHDPSGLVFGSADDMRAMAEALDKIKGSLVAGYVAKSGGSEGDIAALMAKETWLHAAEAVELGFADRLAEPVRIAARFDVGRFRNAPPALVDATAEIGEPANDTGDDGFAEIAEADPPADDAEEDGAAADAVDPPPPEGPDPVPDPAAIRVEALAHAAAVIDLCALAGLPLQARRFLESGASLDEVRAALLAARADATPEVTALHPQPGRSADARPWGEVIAPMSTLTEGRHPGGFLVWEAFRDYCREVVTIDAGSLEPGTVLGKVTVGGKYVAHDPDATDGSETAVAVLWAKADASGGDAPAVALVRGPAIVNRHDLVFAGTPTEPEITAAHAALAAAGIIVR